MIPNCSFWCFILLLLLVDNIPLIHSFVLGGRNYCNLQDVTIITLRFDNITRMYHVENHNDTLIDEDIINVNNISSNHMKNNKEADDYSNEIIDRTRRNLFRQRQRRNIEVPTITVSAITVSHGRSLFNYSNETGVTPGQLHKLPDNINNNNIPETIQVRECKCTHETTNYKYHNLYYCSAEYQYCYVPPKKDTFYAPYCFNESTMTSISQTAFSPLITIMFVLFIVLFISPSGNLAIGYIMDKVFPPWYNQMVIKFMLNYRANRVYIMIQRYYIRRTREMEYNIRIREQQQQQRNENNGDGSSNDEEVGGNASSNSIILNQNTISQQQQQQQAQILLPIEDQQLLDFFYPARRRQRQQRLRDQLAQNNKTTIKVQYILKTKIYHRLDNNNNNNNEKVKIITSTENVVSLKNNVSNHELVDNDASIKNEQLTEETSLSYDDENNDSSTKEDKESEINFVNPTNLASDNNHDDNNNNTNSNNKVEDDDIPSYENNHITSNETNNDNDEEEEEEEEEMCSICYLEIQDGDRIANIPCKHLFHVDCIKVWLNRRNVCPLCLQSNIALPRISTTNNNNTEGGNSTSSISNTTESSSNNNANSNNENHSNVYESRGENMSSSSDTSDSSSTSSSNDTNREYNRTRNDSMTMSDTSS